MFESPIFEKYACLFLCRICVDFEMYLFSSELKITGSCCGDVYHVSAQTLPLSLTVGLHIPMALTMKSERFRAEFVAVIRNVSINLNAHSCARTAAPYYW